jgi:hypothetical protein
MSFFGLTALGPQAPLAVSTDTIHHFHIFTQEDWGQAFLRQVKKSKKKKQQEKIFTPSTADADGDADADPSTYVLPLDRLQALAEDVFHGPVPAAEMRHLVKWVEATMRESKSTPETVIGLPAFMAAVESAHQDAETIIAQQQMTTAPSCGATSWQEYSNDLRKCKAGGRAPPEKYTMPLTAQQEYGWEKPKFIATWTGTGVGGAARRVPKKSSEETKFASEMIKAGHYFYF